MNFLATMYYTKNFGSENENPMRSEDNPMNTSLPRLNQLKSFGGQEKMLRSPQGKKYDVTIKFRKFKIKKRRRLKSSARKSKGRVFSRCFVISQKNQRTHSKQVKYSMKISVDL